MTDILKQLGLWWSANRPSERETSEAALSAEIARAFHDHPCAAQRIDWLLNGELLFITRANLNEIMEQLNEARAEVKRLKETYEGRQR